VNARSRWVGFTQRWVVFIACVAVWQWAAARAASAYFPTPLAIARTMRELWFSGPVGHAFLTAGVGNDIVPSVARLLGGWAAASIAGIVIGITLGLSPVVADFFTPVLAFMRALPPVMLVPLFLVLFHLGTPMQLATIVFGSIWPVLLNSVDGARSVDRTKIDTARAFRIGRLRWIRSVVLPAASPKIFAGLRISLAFALILMVVSEIVGSINGLGFRMYSAEQTFDYGVMWAGIVFISIMGYLFNRLLVVVENRVLSWHRGSMRLLEG
jgi:ABC-type nitrate/sulfonate/bicarbonate transport system permease component